ncbi:hypothetical protein ACFYTS_36280 [Nocardia sp. NPDC004151]|uniref:hypothetical protein n=1 Tax=Nocardia sp. NPDC004151 TaxID=3364304 RepID=UPI00369913B8
MSADLEGWSSTLSPVSASVSLAAPSTGSPLMILLDYAHPGESMTAGIILLCRKRVCTQNRAGGTAPLVPVSGDRQRSRGYLVETLCTAADSQMAKDELRPRERLVDRRRSIDAAVYSAGDKYRIG